MSDQQTTLARVAHLNAVLRGIRNVGKVIARQRDPEAMLREAAKALAEARGFELVTIVRTEGGAITQVALEGRAEGGRTLGRMLAAGELPDCLRRAARDGEDVTRVSPPVSCAGCPVNADWREARDALAVPIEHEGRRFGAVLVSLPAGAADDPDELPLLRELASDLGLALQNLELQAALRQSERMFRVVTENISDVIWVLDVDLGRFTYVSPSVERLRGYTVDEVLAQDMAAALTPRSQAYLAAVMPPRLVAFLRGGAARYVDEIEQPCKDGSTVWTETTTRYTRDELTGHALVYGASRDIGARRRAELALRESEDRFRRALEKIPDVVVIYDRDLRIQYINAATSPITGLAVSDLIGRRDDEIWPPEICGAWLPSLRRARDTGQVQTVTTELSLAPGKRSLEITCVPLFDEHGAVREVVGVTHDITGQRARDELQEKFARVAGSAPGLIVSIHLAPDGTTSMPFATSAIGDMFGLTPDEVAHDLEAWRAGVVPDDLRRVQRSFAESARHLTLWHEGFRFQHPVKGLRWMEGWGSPKARPDGSVDWDGIVLDVTDRQHAEEALRVSIERYRSLFEHMISGLAEHRLIHGEDGAVVDYEYLATNPTFEALTGLRGVVGRKVSEVIPGIHRDNPELLQRYAHVARTGEPTRFESYVPSLDRWFSISVHRPAPGHFATVFDNITDRKRAEQALRESEARFRAIFEEAAVGVAELDSHTGRFILVNQRYADIVGYTREELLEGAWQDLTHPDDLEIDRANVQRLLRGEVRYYSREKRYLHKDGHVVWVALTVARLWADGEPPTCQVAVVLDITARKAAEAALLEAQGALRALTAELEERVVTRTAELARAARAKDEFLAAMSHELRTPLNGILGLTEILGEELYGPLNEKQRTALGRVGESGRHLLSLINDILDLAKVEAGKLELEISTVDVAELCRGSLRLVQEPARRKRIHLALSVRCPTPILADELRLKQVLVNLLTNAVKFTPEGGAAGLEVEPTEDGQALRFVVWDSGIGIAPADLGRLFQPFVQLDGRLSRQHAGTGLGLSLVRQFVGLHGGKVSVTSEVGQGSRFTVILPMRLSTPERAARAATEVPTPPQGIGVSARRKVLLAEDDPVTAEAVASFLEHHGHTVRVAGDGALALALVRELGPDVILMDVQMPGLDGLAAIRALRASAEAAAAPIIALTALVMPGDRERCLAAGADEYLAKPVAPTRLLAAIDRLLAARRG